jgi:tetratricopeptide (TPR) repeat protein
MQLMQQGADLTKAGNLEGAYDAYREAALRDPGNSAAAAQRDATRNQLARRYEREAAQSFQRQNLDDAINKWDRVLALEPNNQKAKLERERAIDLRKKLNEKFGATMIRPQSRDSQSLAYARRAPSITCDAI